MKIKMILQISSGQGPAECEFAVYQIYQILQKEYPDIEMLSSHPTKTKNCYASITFTTTQDLSYLEGTIQWICQSPFRPHHKRKNWYVAISVIPDLPILCKESELKWDRFHCGGKGGQNVNKVETGVRLTHLATGIVVTSTAQRSQLLNRKDALAKLAYLLQEREIQAKQAQLTAAWQEHNKIVRGNPVRIYQGMQFKRKS